MAAFRCSPSAGRFGASALAHLALLAGIFLFVQIRSYQDAGPSEIAVSLLFAPAPAVTASPVAAPAASEPEPAVPPQPAEAEAPPPSPPVQTPASPAPEVVPPQPPPQRADATPAPPEEALPLPPVPPQHVPQRTVAPRPSRAAPVPQATVEQAAPVRGASRPAAPAAGSPVIPPRPVAGMPSDRPPAYPEMARQRGEQGRVLLRVSVGATGLPIAVSVAETSGYRLLDEAARSAVLQWRFVPASQAGRPVPATAEVPVQFRLEG